MERKRLAARAVLAVLVLALAAGCVWYARPVGVRDLWPDLAPDLIEVYLSDTDNDLNTADRRLRLFAGDPGFEDLWARIDALRFRRSPANLLVLALPFLPDGGSSQQKPIRPGEIDHLYLSLSQDNGQAVWRTEALSLWVDQWSFRDFDRGVGLSLSLAGGREATQALAHALWDMAVPEN